MGVSNHSVILDNEGYAWAFGLNSNGQLGLGHVDNVLTPTKIFADKKFKSVSRGETHTLLIDENDLVWGAGANNKYQLGLTTTANQLEFVQLTDEKVKFIEAGEGKSFFINENDYLFCAGNNSYGELGVSGSLIKSFTQVGTKTWKTLSSGSFDTLAIDTSNYLHASGYNKNSQHGDGTTTKKKTFTKIGAKTWKSVACSVFFSMAIDNLGFMYATGLNDRSQHGDGTTTQKTTFTKIGAKTWKSVACGSAHTLAIDDSGVLFGAGGQYNYHLGLPASVDRTYFIALTVDAPSEILDCGATHNIIKSGDSFYSFGDGANGRCGNGSRSSVSTPFLLTLSVAMNRYLFSKSNTAYTIENNALKSLGTITTANASTLFKSGVEAITKEHCVLVGQQLGKAKIMRMLV